MKKRGKERGRKRGREKEREGGRESEESENKLFIKSKHKKKTKTIKSIS